MKKNIKRLLVACALVLFVGLTPQSGYGQIGEGDGGEGTGNPDEVPIDGGISLLVAAGVAYGAKKIYDAKKKKEEDLSDKM